MKTLLATLIFLTGLSTAQTLNSQLSACYPFEGNTQNYAPSGSVLNGISSGISYGPGHLGASSNAVHFAGDTSSYIKLPANSLIKPKQVSVSGWFYADTVQDRYVIYTANSCVSNDEAYSLVYKTNQFMAEIASSINGCDRAQVFSATVSPQTWYHVVFYIDTTIVKLYVNGVMTSQTHSLSWDYVQGAHVVLGNSLNPYLQGPFKGKIDNLRFYDRQLSQAEVTQLYTKDASCVESTVGIYSYQQRNDEVTIFPNPASKELKITSSSDTYTIKISDSSGRLVLEAANEHQVDISSLRAGLFFVEIINDKGSRALKKLVVE